MQILIRSPNWIGDQILAFPFFYYLRKAYPSARIVVACVQWVEAIQYRHLVDEVFVLPRPARGTLSERFSLIEEAAQKLRKLGDWDLGITLPNSFSSAWLFYRSGVKVRRGYGTDFRSFLLNQRVRWNAASATHRVQAYVDLLPETARPVGDKGEVRDFWGIPPENDLDPGIPGELSEFPSLKAWPAATGEDLIEPPEAAKEGYWVLAPGSQAESRSWSVEGFAWLAKRIWDEMKIPGIVVGGPKEAPMAVHLCEDGDLHLYDRCARGSVAGLWSLFKNARFTISNDSGLAHLASLCGSPVHIVWGAGDPRRTKPIGPGLVHVTANPVDCWPCERNSCPLELERKLLCLRGLKPETVWEDFRNWLEQEKILERER